MISSKIRTRRLFSGGILALQDARRLTRTLTGLPDALDCCSLMSLTHWSLQSRNCCTTCSNGLAISGVDCSSSRSPTRWTYRKGFKARFRVVSAIIDLCMNLITRSKSLKSWSQDLMAFRSSTSEHRKLLLLKSALTVVTSVEAFRSPRELLKSAVMNSSKPKIKRRESEPTGKKRLVNYRESASITWWRPMTKWVSPILSKWWKDCVNSKCSHWLPCTWKTIKSKKCR